MPPFDTTQSKNNGPQTGGRNKAYHFSIYYRSIFPFIDSGAYISLTLFRIYICIFCLILPAILSRCNSNNSFKCADEICIISKSHLLSCLLYRSTFSKQCAGLTNAIICDIPTHTKASGRFKKAAQVVLTDKEIPADSIQRNLVVIIVMNIVYDGHHL